MLIFILLFFLQSQLIASNSIRQNRCELKLVADYIFYRDIGNRNYANAARYLVIFCLNYLSISLGEWGPSNSRACFIVNMHTIYPF